MRVYYPETDKPFDERLPLVHSMTVHMESDLDRFMVDNSEKARNIFGLSENEYVAVQDESIVLPPAEFWMWEDHDDYGPN